MGMCSVHRLFPGQGWWVIVRKGSWQDCQGCWGLFSRKSRGMAKSRFSAQSMLLLEGLQMPHEKAIDVFFHPSASLFQGTEAERGRCLSDPPGPSASPQLHGPCCSGLTPHMSQSLFLAQPSFLLSECEPVGSCCTQLQTLKPEPGEMTRWV